ncbi:hypothetical protein [Cellulomonas olei]|uniref:hypothetical protein n=1 Tax=Cellulomonas sp. P4 TaxID=3142533 RepID=UPI0031BA530D
MEHDEGRPQEQPQDRRPEDGDGPAEPPAVTEDAAGTVMELLAEHVPLTLLADLAVAEPRSEAILRAEGLPEDAWWVEPRADDAGAGDAGAGDAAGDEPGAGPGADDELPVDPDAASGPLPEGLRPA